MTTPVADPNALVMNFTADCWLEVTDATGKKLFSGMQRKDGNLNLTGQAPYKLKIGAPAAVQIQYQGKPVDLSRFIRTNQVARLTLNAEQSPAQEQTGNAGDFSCITRLQFNVENQHVFTLGMCRLAMVLPSPYSP